MSLAIPTSSGASAGLFADYRAPCDVYDELLADGGVLRPHWQKFLAGLGGLGPQELGRRWDLARRLIHENGITYNVYADPQGMNRPWELDAIPLLLSPAEWSALSTALVQRAGLLNLVLNDLYGPQTLLHEGLVPPELLFAHSGFLRPCHGIRVPHDRFLHIYAAHLARSPDGRFWVLADRTQVPSGAGYAVENRLVISRMLPALFHDCQVQRLAPYFLTLQETLRNLAPHHRDNPRIVLLSPGPHSPTYFEDAYLARYLGYTLVAGGDLAVRDNRVFLKTLGGLLPVDVILRRLYDEDCDPLELRTSSVLGVPALTQAVRSGNLAIANALGSGLLEAPSLLAFLPEICRRRLGEDLKMPSVGTWWCGRPDDLAYVLEHLDQLVVKPAFPQRVLKPVFGEKLTSQEKADLIAAIRHRPRDYVAQERIARSSTPVWNGNGLQPWHVALRAFLVAQGDSYRVMPGGLSRVSASGDLVGESMSAGEGSKDVWVLSEGPVAPVSLLHPVGQSIPLRRSGNELPSRVADNLFWLGRHVERAEGAVRLLRSIVTRLSSESEPGNMPDLVVLLQVLAEQGSLSPAVADPQTAAQPGELEREIFAFIFDQERRGSLRSTLADMHQVASIVRDRISIDSWRILNRVEHDFLPSSLPRGSVQFGDILDMLNQMIITLVAFSGLAMESMTRTQAWRFLDMGRRLERALYTCGLLKCTLASGDLRQSSVLEPLLEIADSTMTYRSRYLTTLEPAPVIDLLLTDETNPRSVAFQFVALAEHVENLPHDESHPLRSAEQRIMMSALTSLRLTDVEALCKPDKEGTVGQLERILARLTTHLRNLSDSITHTYLIHAGPSRQLTQIKPGRKP